MNMEKQLEIIRKYTVTGIPQNLIDSMLIELGRTREDFDKFMFGQTCALVGTQVLYYPWDVERFIKRLNVID